MLVDGMLSGRDACNLFKVLKVSGSCSKEILAEQKHCNTMFAAVVGLYFGILALSGMRASC